MSHQSTSCYLFSTAQCWLIYLFLPVFNLINILHALLHVYQLTCCILKPLVNQDKTFQFMFFLPSLSLALSLYSFWWDLISGMSLFFSLSFLNLLTLHLLWCFCQLVSDHLDIWVNFSLNFLMFDGMFGPIFYAQWIHFLCWMILSAFISCSFSWSVYMSTMQRYSHQLLFKWGQFLYDSSIQYLFIWWIGHHFGLIVLPGL